MASLFTLVSSANTDIKDFMPILKPYISTDMLILWKYGTKHWSLRYSACERAILSPGNWKWLCFVPISQPLAHAVRTTHMLTDCNVIRECSCGTLLKVFWKWKWITSLGIWLFQALHVPYRWSRGCWFNNSICTWRGDWYWIWHCCFYKLKENLLYYL